MILLADSREKLIHYGVQDCRNNCKSGYLPGSPPRVAWHKSGGPDEVSRSEANHREEVLIAAARAVLASVRVPLEQRQLPPQATASLRLLETALEAYTGPAR
jgi:hypothetical protein